MAAGRPYSAPLSSLAAASSSAKIRISSASSSASAFQPSSAGSSRERDNGSVGGGDSHRTFDRDLSRERSRSESYSSRDAPRDRSNNSTSSHHTTRDGGRDATGRDAGGRDTGRDAGGRSTGRDAGRDVGRVAGGRDIGRDTGRDYRSRNLPRDDLPARDLLSARDSSREGAGGGYGKEKDRGDRNRDFDQLERGRESRDKLDREREREKSDRNLISSSRHQLRQRVEGGIEGAEGGGGGDRVPSPSFGRPPSAGSGSVRPSIPHNSVSPLTPRSDGVLDKETSNNLAESRSSGARLSGKEGTEREPGELPSGRRVEEISWRADYSVSMSIQSRNARHKPLSAEADGEVGNRSPSKKRKFSPIVWDYDEKQARPSSKVLPSSATGASSVSLSLSKIGGSQTSQVSLVQSSASVQVLSSPAPSNESASPPSQPLSSSGRATPPGLPGAEGVYGLSISPEESIPSPVSEAFGGSPLVAETNNGQDSPAPQMQDQVMVSSMSDDEPEPGQLSPEPEESPRKDSPVRIEEDEEESIPYIPPAVITIAGSRWAGETHTPGRERSPRGGGGKGRRRSSSLESEEGRVSLGQDDGHVTSGRSTSPEPGEYIQEKSDPPARAKERGIDSDGSVGQASDGKGRRSQSIEDEEYERQLNERELMELDEEESDADDQEEQRPEVDPEFDDVPPTPSGPLTRAIDMLQGCRTVDEFERLNRIDEGTYGVVYRARNRKTGEIVALKKVKMEKEKEGFPLTSLREINVLLSFHHPSVVDVKEVVVGSTIDSIFMVMEYMEHDLKGLMETMKQPFSQSEVKCLMLQLFEGTKYLHDNWVLHRDLKTSNLLMNNRGELKICDFGLARQYGSPLKAYTHMVVTLWYRAPELLLGGKNIQYSTAIDMWSLGCIMAEFLAKEPLFNGKSEIDQIDKIFKILGTPNEKIWPEFVKLPGVKCNFVRQPYNRLRERFPPTAFAGRPTLSESGFDLLNRLLTYDPQKRITADEALKHDWFKEVPLPKSKEFMPTFPARSEHDRRVRRLMKSPDPLEEQRKRELRQAELGGGGLFG